MHTKIQLKNVVDYFYISLIAAIISIFGTIVANFLPQIYFSYVGLPLYEDITNDKIFTISQAIGYTSFAFLIKAVILTVYFAIKRHKREHISGT